MTWGLVGGVVFHDGGGGVGSEIGAVSFGVPEDLVDLAAFGLAAALILAGAGFCVDGPESGVDEGGAEDEISLGGDGQGVGFHLAEIFEVHGAGGVVVGVEEAGLAGDGDGGEVAVLESAEVAGVFAQEFGADELPLFVFGR